jgi:hypothetical protein
MTDKELIAEIRREQQEAIDACSLSGVNSVMRGNSEEREWALAHKRMNAAREMIFSRIRPKCIDCGATEKLRVMEDRPAHACIYCYARRRENVGLSKQYGLDRQFRDCTPAAKMQPEVVTCDLGVDYE